MKGVTDEHGPVDPGVVHPTDARVRTRHEADHHAVADDEDPDDFIDTIA